LRAKFTNDSGFFVPEVGQGSGVLERSLKIAQCEGEEDDEDSTRVSRFAHILGKGSGKFISPVF